MSSGNVSCSYSASFFKVTRRTEEDVNQRPKTLCEEDNTTPAILVDVPSTVMLTEENFEVNNDLLLTENQNERNTTYLAIKLNRLKDKQARFVSHKELVFKTNAILAIVNERHCTILRQNYKQNCTRHQKYRKFSKEKRKPKPVPCHPNRNKCK